MKKKILAWAVIVATLMTLLTGCGGGDKEPELSKDQRKSIAVLNYLVSLSQEIAEANNNRLLLETAYSELLGNVLPEAVDPQTQKFINGLANDMHQFRMIEEKREFLSYLHEQERASILDSQLDSVEIVGELTSGAVGILVAEKREIVSIVLETLVSVGNIAFTEQQTESVELQYLRDGWELDAQAEKVLHSVRIEAFNYMVDVAKAKNIPGKYTLTESLVAEFVKWKNDMNLTARIQFLESHQDTYKMFGDYWLTLASSYYENSDYSKCVDAVREYEKFCADLEIFRKDYSYAQTLPMYLVSARNVLNEREYTKLAPKYLELILANCDDDDWINRLFAAEVYLELCQLTADRTYMQKAYDVLKNLTNALMIQQQKMNEQYLKEVKLSEVKNEYSDEQKDDTQRYNQMLEELRKTELPPISQPLRMSAEMLLALAEKLQVSEAERDGITRILHNDGLDLFYNLIYDNSVRLNPDISDPTIGQLAVEYTKDDGMKLPVILLSQNSHIKVSVGYENDMITFDDWKLTFVERQGDNVETFLAVFKSEKAKAFKDYKNDMDLVIQIYADQNAKDPDYTINYKVVVETTLWFFDNISFQRLP